MLNLTNVSKYYGQAPILNAIQLQIEKCTIVGLAGPSGSGKSTLLRCIQKLEKIESGTIEYSGTSGFMFQDFQLFPHMTVLENLTYAPKLKFQHQQHEEKALDLLHTLGIKDKALHFPVQLSGGQKQRVALARCLMMKPNVLLCDEPTSGLDVATIEDVVQLLKSVHEMGVTMIIASHDLEFLSRLAHRIIIIKNGTLVQDIDASRSNFTLDELKALY